MRGEARYFIGGYHISSSIMCIQSLEITLQKLLNYLNLNVFTFLTKFSRLISSKKKIPPAFNS